MELRPSWEAANCAATEEVNERLHEISNKNELTVVNYARSQKSICEEYNICTLQFSQIHFNVSWQKDTL
jgi:hypothetical protein